MHRLVRCAACAEQHLVRDEVPELKSVGLRTGDEVRWRSEGWATTQIGNHGLSGYQPMDHASVIAIYGDSQVEGHCVNDADKICNQVNAFATRQLNQRWDCVPLARSSADANDWSRWLQQAERLWQPQWHIWIVTELSDLKLDEKAKAKTSGVWSAPSPSWIRIASDWHAEAAFTIARRLILDSTHGQPRKLRFSVGKVAVAASESELPPTEQLVDPKTIQTLVALNEQLGGRLVIVYSPPVPSVHPIVRFDTPDHAWDDLAMKLRNSVRLIDLRPEHARLWQTEHRMPRGFQNGQPYSGHLNRDGNALIAQVIVEQLLNSDSKSSE